MKLEILRPGHPEPELVDLEGEYFAPVVKLIIFDDLFVFLGEKTWYRFIGIHSYSLEREGEEVRLRQEETSYTFHRPSGISESLYTLFETHEETMPMVKSTQIDISLKRVREILGERSEEIERFSVRLQNDGGIQIVRER